MGDEGKYMVELGKTKKIFEQCRRTQLKDKVKEAFDIQGSFQLQSYDKDFNEWGDVTDVETLPPKCQLKVRIEENQANSGGGNQQNIGPNATIEGVVAQSVGGNAQLGGKGAQFGGKQENRTYNTGGGVLNIDESKGKTYTGHSVHNQGNTGPMHQERYYGKE